VVRFGILCREKKLTMPALNMNGIPTSQRSVRRIQMNPRGGECGGDGAIADTRARRRERRLRPEDLPGDKDCKEHRPEAIMKGVHNSSPPSRQSLAGLQMMGTMSVRQCVFSAKSIEAVESSMSPMGPSPVVTLQRT
jgi:hypothetical protein